jgi:hypothetical protein
MVVKQLVLGTAFGRLVVDRDVVEHRERDGGQWHAAAATCWLTASSPCSARNAALSKATALHASNPRQNANKAALG